MYSRSDTIIPDRRIATPPAAANQKKNKKQISDA